MRNKFWLDIITVKRNFYFERKMKYALQTFAISLWGLESLKKRCREIACYGIICDLRKKVDIDE